MSQPGNPDDFVVEEAARDQSLLRMMLQGPSWAGKTTSSLVLATGIVRQLRALGRLPEHLQRHIGLIDTERGSARKAAGRFQVAPYDILVLEPPYSPFRYMAALSKLEKIGYPVIIVDQISHEWSGQGGVLAMVSAAKGTGNDFTAWNGPSQQHEEFMDRLQHSPAHIICTARSKTHWALVDKKNRRGETVKAPERIGMQAKQREGTEFEFDLVLDLRPGSNEVRCIKDRMGFFAADEVYARLEADVGAKFIEWIYSAERAVEVATQASAADRAVEMADAAKRALRAVPNLPDLQAVWEREQRVLREFSRVAGKEVMAPLLEACTLVKDERKAVLAREKPEGIVRDLDPAELLKGGEAPAPTGVDKVHEITERIAASRPGLFSDEARQRAASGSFADMEDDLPWKDEPGASP